ncbi:MAG: glycoside hydrolase family 97 N-terminal domain-containing protein, partial [Oscillospiraceae bacterium]|nr:glycoside hydrolase family 97 N-terminal domain-containing protein [Oscillospiraceae bacterium]
QAWSIPALQAYYEGIYTREPLSKKDKMSGPVALEVNDSLYMAIMDANLTDYSTMNFAPSGTTLQADLVPWKNGDKVRVGDTRVSPWRAIIIGRKAADILLSRMALNLNEPCKIEGRRWDICCCAVLSRCPDCIPRCSRLLRSLRAWRRISSGRSRCVRSRCGRRRSSYRISRCS